MNTRFKHVLILFLIVLGLAQACKKNSTSENLESNEFDPEEVEEFTSMVFNPNVGEEEEIILNGEKITVNKYDSIYVMEGDIVFHEMEFGDSEIVNKMREDVKIEDVYVGRRWDNGILPFTIDNNVHQSLRNRIIEAINTMSNETNITIVDRTNQKNYVNFKQSDKNWSYFGDAPILNKQNIHLTSDAGIGTIMHEIMHALGFPHEQSRSDRDDYVAINYDNIILHQRYNFFKKNNYLPNTPYDYESIVHYPSYAFSNSYTNVDLSDEKLTILKNVGEITEDSFNFPYVENQLIYRNNSLSNYDIQKINDAYPATSDQSRILEFEIKEGNSENVSADVYERYIMAEVPRSFDLGSLTPLFQISSDATVSPPSGVAQDFSQPVQYVVTAEDRISQTIYTVYVDYEDYITLQAPNGGERWAHNATQNIRWEDNIDENVRIQLWRGDALEITIAESTESDGQYEWTVDSTLPTENTYSIRIASVDDEELRDDSDAPFAIIVENTGGGGSGEADYTNSIGMEFVYVAPGSFQMGSNEGASDERPVHEVEITQGYYMGKYEVTQGQWQEVMGSNPSYFQASRVGSEHLSHPVEQVSWNDIQTFVQRLNEREGGTKYRLPTEAEWEYAARGGQQSQGYTYAGSNDVNEVAWYGGNSSRTHPVGGKAPNELGIYDMSGNVWEWVNDWYSSSYYSQSPRQDPKGPNSGQYRVLRGGSWYTYGFSPRVANRSFYLPNGGDSNLGFRLLRAVD